MPVIKAGKLGDKIYTVRNDIIYHWGRSDFPQFEVNSEVVFWNQEDAEAFRDKMQALIEEASR